ncbi:MAG: DUF6282 family protein [Streptosporangiaceae bacterium]
MGEEPSPSQRARELVRGAYDLHVHVAPDVMERRVTDVELARRCRDVGLSGFALKSHYLPTAERAAVVRAVVPPVDVVGGLTLNASVGGMNPIAVEVFARAGGRIVWFPTVDANNQRESRAKDPPDARPPMWARLQQDLVDQGIAAPPIMVMGDGGEVRPEVRDVLRLIARHDLVLATGHLGREEILAVVDAAVEEGVERVIVTHPEFTSQRVPVEDQRRLAGKGALLERCFTTPHTGKVSWEQVFDTVRAVGPESSVWTTDLGQPFNPPVEDGLALMADTFLTVGFGEDEVRLMAVDNPVRVVKGAGGLVKTDEEAG